MAVDALDMAPVSAKAGMEPVNGKVAGHQHAKPGGLDKPDEFRACAASAMIRPDIGDAGMRAADRLKAFRIRDDDAAASPSQIEAEPIRDLCQQNIGFPAKAPFSPGMHAGFAGIDRLPDLMSR